MYGKKDLEGGQSAASACFAGAVGQAMQNGGRGGGVCVRGYGGTRTRAGDAMRMGGGSAVVSVAVEDATTGVVSTCTCNGEMKMKESLSCSLLRSPSVRQEIWSGWVGPGSVGWEVVR